MRLAVVAAGKFAVHMTPDGITPIHFPLNAGYALDEATALAAADHDVWLLDAFEPCAAPLYPVDLVYAPCHVSGALAVSLAAGVARAGPDGDPTDGRPPALVRVTTVGWEDGIGRTDTLPGGSRGFTAELLRRVPVVATAHDAAADWLRRLTREAESDAKVAVIPHFVEPPGEVLALADRPRVRRAVYVGTRNPVKQVARAVEIARDAGVPLALVSPTPPGADPFVGDQERAPIEEIIGTPGNKWTALATSRVCITTSAWETLWLPGAEALAVGTVALVPADLPLVRDFYGDAITYYKDDDDAVALVRKYCSMDDIEFAFVAARCRAAFAGLGMTRARFAAGFASAAKMAVEAAR